MKKSPLTFSRCCAPLFLLLSLGVPSAVPAHASDVQASLFPSTRLPFYIYHSYKSSLNHYAPSGWMGDYGDIRFNDRWTPPKHKNARAAIRVEYTAKASQKNGWAGIYWQNPPNNWGHTAGGYNLNGAKQLVFLARGENGEEVISQFKVGGISGDFADSGTAAIGPITLTKDWKEYRISLEGQELSSISGGFCWTVVRNENPDGATFYLDKIRFE